MSARLSLASLAIAVVLVVGTALAALETGSLLVAIGLVALAALIHALMRATPSGWSLALLLTALILDDPQSLPNEGRWKSPVHELGRVMYENLRHLTGVEVLRFSLFECLVLMLAVTLMLRRHFKPDTVSRWFRGRTRWLRMSLSVCGATVVWLCLYGQLRGGDFRQAMWQGRQLFWLPVLGFIFVESIVSKRDRDRLLGVIVGAAVVRGLLALYYYFVISKPAGHFPHYATSHSDTVLFCGATIIAVAKLLEASSRRAWVTAGLLVPLMLASMAVNNRRLAYVALAGCVLSSFPLWRPSVRKFLAQSAAVAAPLLALYLAAGWSSGSRFFRPATAVRSIVSTEDSSTETRSIENYNLTYTMLSRPVLGQGLGHPYDEQVEAYSIESSFSQYRFIAHNSVLWLLAVGGLVGFLGIWMVLPLTSLYAWRAYRRAKRPDERISAVFAHSSVVLYVAQAYGDIGMQSWVPTLVAAAALGMVGNLAASVGALDEPFAPNSALPRYSAEVRS